MRTLDPTEAVERARAGDRLALSRLISAVEERSAVAEEIGRLVPPGRAHVIGITGAPGVGKSTTTAALIEEWRSRGRTVAVVAVDPSSPFTGGALLGDRVRMEVHSTDPGVYIRSMAARGQLGGLAAATPAAVGLLSGLGFDIVVVETVGVGQSEVDIVRYADTVLILQAPGMGDRIQATKAGLLEIGDVFAVNKSDRPGANLTKRELGAMIAAKPLTAGQWRPPVVPVVATQGEGVADLVDLLDAHQDWAANSGSARIRRTERAAAEITALVLEVVQRGIRDREAELSALAARVAEGSLGASEAARLLLPADRPVVP